MKDKYREEKTTCRTTLSQGIRNEHNINFRINLKAEFFNKFW